ncbi:peptidoglycan-binding protein [Streptomyces alanosinicus]|nr:peptidoglycan-binding protein [Streptomyces alanosinicus]
MTAPVFEEFDPASDCDCPGCVPGRWAGPRLPSGRTGSHPAATCGIVAVAAASAVLGAVAPAAAVTPGRPTEERPPAPGGDEPETPQGGRAPLHGPAGKPATPTVPIPAATRTQIINRAKLWVTAQVPYSMSAFWSDGYRQDCSGFVSMAWGLPGNEWTGSLGQYGVKITKEELQPGDILLYHNLDNPQQGSHVVIFGGWTDYTHTNYTVYEQTPPHARKQATPYPYWSHTDKYVPYRYKGVTGDTTTPTPGTVTPPATVPPPATATTPGTITIQGTVTIPVAATSPVAGSPEAPGYPGRSRFRPGEENADVAQLRRRLVRKGFGGFYATGHAPGWGDADRRAVGAFQRAQGWRGGAADGYPGPETWRRLFAAADPGEVIDL